MYSNEAYDLYDKMCRIVGDMVFTLHDFGIDSKQMGIADALRAALAHKCEECSELLIGAMEAATRVLH